MKGHTLKAIIKASLFTGVMASMQIANAAIVHNADTVWSPNGEDVNVIQLSFPTLSLHGGTLALFEDTDSLDSANALVLGSDGGTFKFIEESEGSYRVESYVDDALQDFITMSGSEFVLAVDWGNGYVPNTRYFEIEKLPSSYYVFFREGLNHGRLFMNEVTPVPVPGAAFLFGSALIGLASLRKWRK